MKHLDLNLLLLFQALMKERHVGRAAQQVGMSQPAFSNALSRLRQQVGDPLFVRTSRGMEPTETARRILEPVNEGLATIEDAIAPEQPFDPVDSTQTFTFMGADYYELLVLAPMAERLHREAPGVSINMIRMGNAPVQALERGEVDFVLDKLERPVSDAFYEKHLWNDEFVGICREGHPLKIDADGKVALEDYLSYDHAQITVTGVGKGDTDQKLSSEGKSRNVRVFTRQSALVPPYYVLETDLLAIVAKRVVMKLKKHLPLRVFVPPVAIEPFANSVVWSAVSQHSRAHKWMRGVLLEEAAKVRTS